MWKTSLWRDLPLPSRWKVLFCALLIFARSTLLTIVSRRAKSWLDNPSSANYGARTLAKICQVSQISRPLSSCCCNHHSLLHSIAVNHSLFNWALIHFAFQSISAPHFAWWPSLWFSFCHRINITFSSSNLGVVRERGKKCNEFALLLRQLHLFRHR